MPDGSTASCDLVIHTNCDRAPSQSPKLVEGLSFNGGSTLTITAKGLVNNYGFDALFGPDGNPSWIQGHDAGAENGISDILPIPLSSLVGVFLGPAQPDGSAAPTPATDPTHPALKQVFLIGSNSAVVVPAGASRLFLGTMDSWQWSVASTVPATGDVVNASVAAVTAWGRIADKSARSLLRSGYPPAAVKCILDES